MASIRRRIEELEKRAAGQDKPQVYYRRDGEYYDRWPFAEDAEVVPDPEITDQGFVIEYVNTWGGRKLG